MEAEYAMDWRHPLQLYDCLVPALRENRKLQIPPECYTNKHLLEDVKAKQMVRKYEY